MIDRKLIFVLLLALLVIGTAQATTYTSQYPPAYSSTYVKATTETAGYGEAHQATNPSLSLTGDWAGRSWIATGSDGSQGTNQRFHIDLGSAKVITRIYYENSHYNAVSTDYGVKTFTIWGSNTAGSFSDLTYANDAGWTEITPSQYTFDQHVAADTADPKYITLTNTNAYRYYAFKFADTWGGMYKAFHLRRVELQTTDALTVSTQATGSIAGTTATGYGTIVNIGSASPTHRGVAYNTAGSPTTSDPKIDETGSFGTGAFSESITGLTKGQKYYLRAYATNTDGTAYGEEVNFTTLIEPTVTTQAATFVLSTSATGNGNIISVGGVNATIRGICYNTAGTPTTADSKVQETGDFGTGAFTESLTGLTTGTPYFARAYATNSVGTSYGAEVTFTPANIAVTTDTTTDIYETSATGHGNITTISASAPTVRGFAYGVGANPTIAGDHVQETGTYGIGTYSLGISGLAVTTTYHIRAFATNTEGTVYGTDATFITATPTPESDRVGFAATSNQSGITGSPGFDNGIYTYNGTYESPVGIAYADAFGSNTTFRYMPAHYTTTATVVAGTDQVSGGKLTVTDGTYLTVVTRLKSYKSGGGVYEMSFDNNDDGGSVTDLNGMVIGMQDFDNFYRIVIGNDTVSGMSNLSIQKRIAGTYTVVNITSTNSTYVRSNKTWIKVKFDPNQGVMNAWLRDDAGAYTSEPTIIGFVSGTMPYGYFGFYSMVGTAGAGNLNVDYDDLTVKAELYVGTTHIPIEIQQLSYSDNFNTDSSSLYNIVTVGSSAVSNISGGRFTTTNTGINGNKYGNLRYPTLLQGTVSVNYSFVISSVASSNNVAYIGLESKTLDTGLPSDGYFLIAKKSPDNFVLYSLVGGVATPLATTTKTVSSGSLYYMRLDWDSNTGDLKGYFNNEALPSLTATDSSFNGEALYPYILNRPYSAGESVSGGNFAISGTAIRYKPIYRNAAEGEYWDGANIVKVTQESDNFNFPTTSEYVIGSSAVIDNTNARLELKGSDPTYLNNVAMSDGEYAFLLKRSTGETDVFNVKIANNDVTVTGAGVVTIGGTAYAGTALTSPVWVQFVATGTQIAVYSNGVLIGTKTGLTLAPTTVQMSRTTANVYVLDWHANALESTAPNGIQAGIDSVAHGAMYDTANTAAIYGYAPLNVQFRDVSDQYLPINPTLTRNFTYQGIVSGNDTQKSFSTTSSPYVEFGEGNFSIKLDNQDLVGTTESPQTFWINVTPSSIASFTTDKTSGVTPLVVTVTDTSTNSPTSYLWYVDETPYTTSTIAPQTFVSLGTHKINLTVSNPSLSPLISTYSKNIYVNQTSGVDFNGTPTSGYAVSDVTFVDMSTGAGLSAWLWDFGDGGTSTIRNTTHTYTAPGNYTVSLTVTGLDGQYTKTMPNYITMAAAPDINADSTLQFKPDANIIRNLSVYTRTIQVDHIQNASFINGTTLFDTDNIQITSVAVNATTYADLDLTDYSIDNTTGTIAFNISRTGDFFDSIVTPTSIIDIGMFYDRYKSGVTGAGWGSAVLGNATYKSTSPVAHLVDSPLTYSWTTFSNFTVSDPNPVIEETAVTFTPVEYTYLADRFSWDFGDGNVTLALTGAPITHVYGLLVNSTLNPSLTVYLSADPTVTNTTTLSGSVSPVFNHTYINANFTAAPTSGPVGILIEFTDESKYGTDVGLSYNWSFGDDLYSPSTAYSNQIGDVSHVYTALGIYTVNLTITNSEGTSSKVRTNYIQVSTDPSDFLMKYPPGEVFFHTQTLGGDAITGVTVTAQAISTSMGSYAWIAQLLGYPLEEIPLDTTPMTGTTDSAGDISFLMMQSTQYNMTATKSGYTFNPMLIYANSNDHYYIIAIENGTYYPGKYDNLNVVNLTVTTNEISATQAFVNVSYDDAYGGVTSGTIKVMSRSLIAGQAPTLIAEFPVNTSQATFSTLITHTGPDQFDGYVITNINNSNLEKPVNLTKTFWFKGEPVTLPGVSPKVMLWFAFLVIGILVMCAGASHAPQVSFIVCFMSWLFYGWGAFSELFNYFDEWKFTLALTTATFGSLLWIWNERKRKEKY